MMRPSKLSPKFDTILHVHSRQNARLKELRQHLLHPAGVDGRIAIEGIHLLQEAVRSGLAIETLFLREDLAAQMPPVPARETLLVAEDAFDHACATETPQGVAALVQTPTASLPQILQNDSPLLVVLDGIQDPGNLGTIFRSAEAFGASGVLLLPGTVSPWNQKAVRASAGSVFRVPLVSVADTHTLVRLLHQHSIALYAAVARNGTGVAQTPLTGPVALLIGNEGAGVSAKLLHLADGRVYIPCVGPVESLNAGVAASILLYAASQQRSMETKSLAASARRGHSRMGPNKKESVRP
jgi:TrmH family RNA methyltransferase